MRYPLGVTLQGVVFDFDGTIFDTESVTYQAVADVYALHHRELDRHWWSMMIGTTTDATITALERLADDVGLDLAFVTFEIRTRVRELLSTAQARPGVESLVRECQAAGVPIAIATSAPRDWVERHLANLDLLDDFRIMVPVDEVENAKPHPEPYLTACRLMGAEPRWSVAIEDSPPGVRSAVAAGLFTLGVAGALTATLDLSHAHRCYPSLASVDLAALQAAILDHQPLR